MSCRPKPDRRRTWGCHLSLSVLSRRLSRSERGVIALRFGADLRGPEIAELLDMSLANVQQIMSRALRRLRQPARQRRQSAEGSGAGRARAAAMRSRQTPDPA